MLDINSVTKPFLHTIEKKMESKSCHRNSGGLSIYLCKHRVCNFIPHLFDNYTTFQFLVSIVLCWDLGGRSFPHIL